MVYEANLRWRDDPPPSRDLPRASGVQGNDGPQVTVAPVDRATVTEVVEAPATVTAKATATLSATSDGRVAVLRVRDGQQVRAGQVLLRIESPSARRALRQAKAADANAASAGSVRAVGGGLSA